MTTKERIIELLMTLLLIVLIIINFYIYKLGFCRICQGDIYNGIFKITLATFGQTINLFTIIGIIRHKRRMRAMRKSMEEAHRKFLESVKKKKDIDGEE